MLRTNQLLGRAKPDRPDTSGPDAAGRPPVAILAVRDPVETSVAQAVLRNDFFKVVPVMSFVRLVGELSKFAENNVRLIVVDQSMIEGSPEGFCRLVEHQTRGVASVVVIGDDKKSGPVTGAPGLWVPRPLDLDQFETALRILGRSSDRSHAQRVPDPVDRSAARAVAPQTRNIRTTGRFAPRVTRTPGPARQDTTDRVETEDHVQLSSRMPEPSPRASRPRDAHRVVVRALDEALPTDSGTVDRTLEPRYQIEKGIDSRAALLYREAFDYLTACTNRMRSGEPLDLAAAFDIASRLVDCLESGKDLLILATDRASGYSWRQHSVNVAILAAQTGMTMNLAVETVLKIAIAGLVHDVGTLKLPSRLTLVSTDLSRKDREEIHRRPAYSAALLSDDPSFSWLPAIVARVYERENGKGYPKGLSGADIPIESKVIGVVDVFEACIHARPQRPPLTGHTALEVLTAETNRFSERVTKAMIRAFSVYPYNERVVLNTGELCQVVDVNSNSPMRPVVRIIEPIEGREHRQDQVLDLSISPHLWIAKAVTMPRDGAGD